MLAPEEHFVYGRLKTIYGYESIARACGFFSRTERHTHTNTHFDSAMFGPNDFASLFGARILFGRMQSHDRGKMQ